MRIAVIGINHKQADLKLREILARTCQRRFGTPLSIHNQHAFILLSTCNRTEIYFSSPDLTETHSYILNILNQEVPFNFDQKLYSYFGPDCFKHLVQVTAGLDSAIIAETEIQGQVKGAYENRAHQASLPPVMHFVFQKSLKISKEIRHKYSLGRGMPDLEDAVLQAGKQHLSNPFEKSILFVGASEINQKVLQFLQKKGCQQISICNRSQERAEQVSMRYQIPLLPWAQRFKLESFDWIIFGTKANEYLLTEESIQSLTMPKLIIDLACPRNVDPKIKKWPLLNIDQINRMLKFRKKKIADTLKIAEKEISQRVESYAGKYLIKIDRFAEVA